MIGIAGASWSEAGRPETREDFIACAKALAPRVARRAEQTESLRRLPDETVEDLRRSGLLRMMVPRKFGGFELDFDTLLDVTLPVAGGCGASGWLTSLYVSHGWLAGIFSAQAQQDVWANGPDTIIATQTGPLGKARRADDGFIVSGSWAQASGLDHADWIVLGAGEAKPDGTRENWELLLERKQFRIDDTWFSVGCRGSGSKTVVVEEQFVPIHRAIRRVDLGEGTSPGGALPGAAALYRLPLIAGFFGGLVAPIIGAARGALEICGTKLASRTGEPAGQQAVAHAHFAESAAEIDCAELLLRRHVQEAQATVAAGAKLTTLQRARMRRDGAYAAMICNRALTQLIGSCGGSILYESSPVQRAWRDVRMMSAHIMLNLDAASELWGRVAIGLPPSDAVY